MPTYVISFISSWSPYLRMAFPILHSCSRMAFLKHSLLLFLPTHAISLLSMQTYGMSFLSMLTYGMSFLSMLTYGMSLLSMLTYGISFLSLLTYGISLLSMLTYEMYLVAFLMYGISLTLFLYFNRLSFYVHTNLSNFDKLPKLWVYSILGRFDTYLTHLPLHRITLKSQPHRWCNG